MRTIVKCSMISEATMTPVIDDILYDHDADKFFRRNSRLTREYYEDICAGNISYDKVLDMIDQEEQLTDDEVVEMYNTWMKNRPLIQPNQKTDVILIVERYIKRLNRNEKLGNLGI